MRPEPYFLLGFLVILLFFIRFLLVFIKFFLIFGRFLVRFWVPFFVGDAPPQQKGQSPWDVALRGYLLVIYSNLERYVFLMWPVLISLDSSDVIFHGETPVSYCFL